MVIIKPLAERDNHNYTSPRSRRMEPYLPSHRSGRTRRDLDLDLDPTRPPCGHIFRLTGQAGLGDLRLRTAGLDEAVQPADVKGGRPVDRHRPAVGRQ